MGRAVGSTASHVERGSDDLERICRRGMNVPAARQFVPTIPGLLNGQALHRGTGEEADACGELLRDAAGDVGSGSTRRRECGRGHKPENQEEAHYDCACRQHDPAESPEATPGGGDSQHRTRCGGHQKADDARQRQSQPAPGEVR